MKTIEDYTDAELEDVLLEFISDNPLEWFTSLSDISLLEDWGLGEALIKYYEIKFNTIGNTFEAYFDIFSATADTPLLATMRVIAKKHLHDIKNR